MPRDTFASISVLCALATVLASACASSPSSPPVAVAAETPAAAPVPPRPVAPTNPPAAVDAYDDPGELHDPETMTPLFGKDSRPAFPKATAGDHECWQTIQLSGDAKTDFDALVSRCGAPTGSVQYVAPVVGKLHYVHDKRDTFDVKIQGGLCYRFFGVADGSIQDLDILIERANGDLVGDDKTNGPVAIIDMDKNWCMDADGDYKFAVEVDGTGTGNYAFGVWARPKKK
jgi:hypothetical protein